jgi:hypothetical protein
MPRAREGRGVGLQWGRGEGGGVAHTKNKTKNFYEQQWKNSPEKKTLIGAEKKSVD